MKTLLQYVSWAALLGVIVPALLFLGGAMMLDRCKWIMLLATIAWFVVTPFWMGREALSQD
jgi:hypothetical protein